MPHFSVFLSLFLSCSSPETGGGNGGQQSPLQLDSLVSDLGLDSPLLVAGLTDENDDVKVLEYVFSPFIPKAVNHVWKEDKELSADVQENSTAKASLGQEDMEGDEYWEEGEDAFEDEGDDFDSRDSFDDSSKEGVEGSSTQTEASTTEWVKHFGILAYHANKACVTIASTCSTEIVSPLPYTALIQQLQVN